MLKDPVTIKSEHELKPSQDYDFLLQKAISLCQELSGNIWTDYNQHDPGVTLLTQVCYALSEVGYRTEIDLERLLYYGKHTREKRQEVDQSNAFFSPSEIFPTGAVTLDDYRILIIDKIEGVADAWVMPVKNNRYGFKGLYKVVLQLNREFDGKDDQIEVVRKVEELLSANRNLCEDFDRIEVLVAEPITFKARLELKTESVEEEVLASIFKRIQDYFSPPTTYSEKESLVQKGLTNQEIFNAPSFENGFLTPNNLTEYGRLYYISKIAELISTVPGVWNLSDFEVYLGNTQLFDDKISLEDGHYPFLNMDAFLNNEASFKIELTKGGISTNFNTTAVEYYLDSQKRKTDKNYDLSGDGRNRKIQRTEEAELRHFESIQNTFPALYGIGQYGRRSVIMDVRQKTDAVRDGHVKQLQAFLYFFDQFLTNHLEQLASVRELFSIEPTPDLKSYFSQLFYGLDDDREFSQGDKPGELKEKTDDLFGYYSLLRSNVREEIERLRAERDPVHSRIDRVLSHLLARFGEGFLIDKLNNLKEFFDSPEASVNNKKELLKNVADLGRRRSCGFDYMRPSFGVSENENIPPFKTKIALLLNLPLVSDTSLVCHTGKSSKGVAISDVKAKETQVVKKEFEEAKTTNDLAHFPIIVKKEKRKRVDLKDVDHLPYLFKYGTIRKNYDILPHEDGVVVIYNPFEKKTGFKIFEDADEAKAEARLNRLIGFLKQLENQGCGFHVVEHLLLRPLSVDQHRFIIRDKAGRELLESVVSDERSVQVNNAENAIEAGLSKDSYVVEPKADKFIVKLKKEGEVLAQSIDVFVSQEQALDKIEHVFLKEIKKYAKGFDPAVTILTPLDDTNTDIPDPEKVNHRLSLVIPNWVSRFQNKDFVKFLKLALKENLPSWCQCELLFVTNKQMIDFEDMWQEWLDLKRLRATKLQIDQKSTKLVQFLNLLPSDD